MKAVGRKLFNYYSMNRMKIPKGGDWTNVVTITLATAAGIAAYGFALQGRLMKPSTSFETVIFALAGTLLVFPSLLDAITMPLAAFKLPHPELAGLAVLLAGAGIQYARGAVTPTASPT